VPVRLHPELVDEREEVTSKERGERDQERPLLSLAKVRAARRALIRGG
jgi:hypothetical protein